MTGATLHPRHKRPLWLRILLWLLFIVVLLLVIVLAGGYIYLRHSTADTSGTVKVKGITAPVDIVRDADGVPHIYAQNENDALYALGYVHAQDRLWQMEMQRRIGRGTLAEVLGDAAVSTDRFLRTLGVYRTAQTAYDALNPATKTIIDSYTSGINAFLAEHSGWGLPPEFTVVGVKPEPWNGADVLVWAKMMAWDLGGNYSTELLRTDLINKVGPERSAELLTTYPEDGAIILPNYTGTSGAAPISEMLALADEVQQNLGMGAGIIGGTGSNNWVISGAKSTTGQPLLANDPHLGFRTPAIWYLAEVQGGNWHAVGTTIPGLPGIVVGHNEHIAWGVTNLGPDVQDLYRERIDPSGTMVEYKGQMEPLTIIEDTIKVSGGADVPLKIRVSRHGPLISDALNANNETADAAERGPEREALAFRWTALDATDTTMEAFWGINQARNWDDFTAALRVYVAPSQNFVYADREGNIGYYTPGNIPIRASGDGSVPAEGWSGANDWTSFIPFEQLPHTFNPPEGFVATANNRAIPEGYPYFISNEWAQPYRANRITQLITAKDKLSVDDMAAIQADRHSLFAETLLPTLLAQTVPADDAQRQALDLLRTWDYDTSGDSAPAAIFEAWAYYLPASLIGDELGSNLTESYMSRSSFVQVFVPETLQNSSNPWCDDTTTGDVVEDCPAIMQQALKAALNDLGARMPNNDMTTWRWDDVHIALFAHNPLDNVSALKRFFSNSIANGGDGSTVNVAAVNSEQPYYQTAGPIFREIIDISDWQNSRFINTPGQAGHPMSPHFDDLLQRWQRVEYLPMHFGREAVGTEKVDTLRLEP